MVSYGSVTYIQYKKIDNESLDCGNQEISGRGNELILSESQSLNDGVLRGALNQSRRSSLWSEERSPEALILSVLG